MSSNQLSPNNTPESIATRSIDLEESPPTEAAFPIVGIAASAGGLEAFIELLGHLPLDTGMAFVLIQHLDPDHKSFLAEILSRTTPMPVNQVRDGVAVEPNQVYVIPPNTKMVVSQGVLELSPREKVYGKYLQQMRFLHPWRSIADTKRSR